MSDEADAGELPSAVALGLRQGFRMQYEPAQECEVLLFPEGMVTLSGSAAEILKKCDGSRDRDGIVAALEQEFPGDDLRDDVLEFLQIAWRKGWIVGK